MHQTSKAQSRKPTTTLRRCENELVVQERRIREIEADLAVMTGMIQRLEPIAGVQQQPNCE